MQIDPLPIPIRNASTPKDGYMLELIIYDFRKKRSHLSGKYCVMFSRVLEQLQRRAIAYLNQSLIGRDQQMDDSFSQVRPIRDELLTAKYIPSLRKIYNNYVIHVFH